MIGFYEMFILWYTVQLIFVYILSTLQGGSDISGTLSKLHYSIKKSSFLFILSQQTISAVCRTICKNKQAHFGKDELTRTSKRRDCLWTSRRTNRAGDYELQRYQYKVTFLANNLDELITRDPSRFLRSLEQEMNISEQL